MASLWELHHQRSISANHLNSYVYHAARTANLDVLNLGLSGSCLCEAEMAEFLGSRQDYEVATLEVGVNMRKVFTVEEYRRKVHHLLDAVAAPGTNRRVFLLTLFSNMNDPELDEKQDAFSQVLREAASIGRWQGVSLIEGGAVLDDPGDLTVDLIHPSDYGHARMASIWERSSAKPSHEQRRHDTLVRAARSEI